MASLNYRLDDSPRGLIIKLLQRHGALGIKELRRELGLSDTAVRQQLYTLMADGLVRTTTSEPSGVGRPSHLYELADGARDLFACYCEDLALSLYDELLTEQGPDVVHRLLNRVGDRLAHRYQQQVRGVALQERVRSFARVLDDRGILSDVDRPGDTDVIMLYEYNCPYYELASVHREICAMEQTVFAQVLDARVELTNCMMDGHNGCSFAVTSKENARLETA